MQATEQASLPLATVTGAKPKLPAGHPFTQPRFLDAPAFIPAAKQSAKTSGAGLLPAGEGFFSAHACNMTFDPKPSVVCVLLYVLQLWVARQALRVPSWASRVPREESRCTLLTATSSRSPLTLI